MKAFAKDVCIVAFLMITIGAWIVFLPYDIWMMIYSTIKSGKGVYFLLGYIRGYWDGSLDTISSTLKKIEDF